MRNAATVSEVDAARPVIPVVYGVDNRFAVPLAASIESALDNLAPEYWLDLYIIDGGLSARNRLRLVRSFKGRRCRLMWLRPKGERLTALKVGGAITIATYYRLLIPRLLPDLEKAIYLDADVVVRGDLAKLWHVPLQGRLLLAVQDQGIRTVSGEFGLSNYDALRIPKGSKYFNAGVLVLNLTRWRAENTAETVVRYIHDQHEYIRFHDQDGLNAVLWRDWGELDPRWNQMPQILQVDRASNSPFDSETFQLVRSDPYVVHYASADKPWRFGCRHPAAPQFFDYIDRTAFRGFRPTRWGTRLKDLAEGVQNRARRYLKSFRG
jgi:lipopolysaccharide biosynthesis glycosyltransferase